MHRIIWWFAKATTTNMLSVSTRYRYVPLTNSASLNIFPAFNTLKMSTAVRLSFFISIRQCFDREMREVPDSLKISESRFLASLRDGLDVTSTIDIMSTLLMGEMLGLIIIIDSDSARKLSRNGKNNCYFSMGCSDFGTFFKIWNKKVSLLPSPKLGIQVRKGC